MVCIIWEKCNLNHGVMLLNFKVNGLKSEENNIKLWNKNFFLLWQGQLVSMLGDVLYLMALDLWILDMTGSAALMGIVSALSIAPAIVLGPFAGVFVDKWNRKNILVITDFIRGVLVTFIGIAGIMGFIKVWMIIVVAIISSMCSAFFNPAVSAIKPQIVHRSKLVKANSITSFAESSSNMLGNAIAGFLYVLVGAPYMFLFNGISYIFSAISEMFIKVPEMDKTEGKITFKEDFKEGLHFVGQFKTFKNMFIVSCIVNFFVNAAFVLLPVLFKQASYLGIERYGIAMAISSLGMVLGSLTLSIVNVKNEKKYFISAGALVLMGIMMVIMPITKNFYIFAIAFCAATYLNVVSNTIMAAVRMTIIPKQMMGKVFALMGTLSMALIPLAKIVGGFLGEFLPVRTAMIIFFGITLIGCLILPRIKGLKSLMKYDGEESIERLIAITNDEYEGRTKTNESM